MDHEECFNFTHNVNDSQSLRKRRKRLKPTALDSPANSFPSLMRGFEDEEGIECRYDMFQTLWQPQEDALEDIINTTNEKAIHDVRCFVDSASDQGQGSKIQAALIIQGPGNSTFTGLYDVLCNDLGKLGDTACIKLTAGQSPNLRTVLRYINQAAAFPDNDHEHTNGEARRQLNYDLETLHHHVKRESLRHVVLLFEDGEAFDGALLSDLIDLLNLWNDRIPFILLFGIATSIQIFQSKLSRKAMSCLDARTFNVERVDLEKLFKTVHGQSTSLFLGAGLSKLIIERQENFISDAQSFVQSIKYAYMTHCFSNPLSVWLDPLRAPGPSNHYHMETIRNLSSFRRFLQAFIDAKQYKTARELLSDDDALRNLVISEAHGELKALRNLVSAVDVLFILREALESHHGWSHTSWSELYILAASGGLSEADLFKTTFASLKLLDSNVFQECLRSIERESCAKHDPDLHIDGSLKDVTHLVTQGANHAVLRSGHDIQPSNLRTTVVAQRVELGRSSTKVTAQEFSYTKIVDKFVSKLELFFGSRLFNPQKSLLHDVFVYDARTLNRDVFMPRPRFAIERALDSPLDYLACACCHSTTEGCMTLQLATANVYQLYLESGSVINTSDLWSAYWTIVGPEKETEDDWKGQALAHFSKALAELKYLGLIRSSRKKVDHLAKLAWQGL